MVKMKKKIVKLSSPRLRSLEKDLEKIQKGEKYLEAERKKIMKEKGIIRKKIKKEKKILSLKNQINRMRGRKK